jgi:hypothetical protein
LTPGFTHIMSISPIIDEHYRLRPTDLGRSSVQVTIQNVSWQGVEQLRPLLHLREFPQKRLLLTSPQMQTLIDIVGSSVAQDWIGHTILLLAEYDDGELTIMLYPRTAILGRMPQLRPHRQLHETGRTLLLITLLGLIFGLVYLLDQAESLWSLF